MMDKNQQFELHDFKARLLEAPLDFEDVTKARIADARNEATQLDPVAFTGQELNPD